jgi:hypothetical protein
LKVLKVSEMAAQRASAGGHPKFEQLGSRPDFDTSLTLSNIQSDFLTRKFGLAASLAAVVARLAWEARQ